MRQHKQFCADRKKHAENNNCWKYFLTWNAHCTILKQLKGQVSKWLLWHDPMFTGKHYNGWSEDQLEDFVANKQDEDLRALKRERDLRKGIYWTNTMPKKKVN